MQLVSIFCVVYMLFIIIILIHFSLITSLQNPQSVKDAVSVANNACWAIGELAIKVSAYFYTIWFNPVLNSFAIHKIPFCLF